MKFFLTTIALIFVSGFAFAATPLVASGGEVKFTAVGKPGFLKIQGASNGKFPAGKVMITNGLVAADFDFELKSLDTGIELRNKHMKEKYLEVAKFPIAKLVVKSVTVTEKELASDFKKDFSGALTLHGVTKDISGEFNYLASSKTVSAKFTIKVSDFNIDIPKYMGVTVSETVNIDVITKLQ